jgi:proteasome assembly chaperone (PAC2) family protein
MGLLRLIVASSQSLGEIPCLGGHSGYLVDPASSHMLMSKIKPCMSKYKRLYTVKLRMAH